MSAIPLLVPERLLHPPGLVGIPSGEQGRWTEFTRSLMVLQRPERTRVAFVYGAYIQANRDELVRQTLDSGAQWLFMVDDDHTFDPKLLINLLDRYVPVVGALALARKPPYFICAFSETNRRTGESRGMPMHGFEFRMQEVAAVGTGAILIRREVLEALEPPWFASGYDERGANVSEDVSFCERAREAGFPVWLDGTQKLGHLTGVSLTLDERGVVFDLNHEQSIVIPMEQIEEEDPVSETTPLTTREAITEAIFDSALAIDQERPLEEEVPIVVGASGLTGRIPIVRAPDELEQPVGEDEDGQPVYAQPPSPGKTIPSGCLRLLTSFRQNDGSHQCDSYCQGRQRDGGCLADIVRKAIAQGVEWEFEVRANANDPTDQWWEYVGAPLRSE